MNFKLGHEMAQVVRYRPLTTEDQLQSQASPSGICGGQSGTGIDFSLGTYDSLSV